METNLSKINITKMVDCIGENCPMPLVMTRAAILESKKGDVIKVVGTHPQSYEEIPLALEVLEKEILERVKEEEKWYITFTV
jgi:TusA-related sulfurtransferase